MSPSPSACQLRKSHNWSEHKRENDRLTISFNTNSDWWPTHNVYLIIYILNIYKMFWWMLVCTLHHVMQYAWYGCCISLWWLNLVRWKIFTVVRWGYVCILYWGTLLTTDNWPNYRPHLSQAGQDFLTVELNIILLSGLEQNNILFIFKQTKFF